MSDITQPSLIAIRYVLPSLKLRTVTYAVYFLAVFSLAACSQPNPTATPSPGSESASLSVTALTASHVPIDAAEPTATASIPPSPSAVPTNTAEPTATATVPPSPSAVPTNTAEPTATPTVPPSPSAVPTNTAEPTATPTVPPSPSPVPTNTAEPTATAAVPPATLGDKSPAEVYALVAPSVPFIETAAGTGSGILIEGGYVVTNYHVVWPYESVWVVFPDGTELANVPVVGWDPMADLAVLGPVNVAAQALTLSDGEGTALGSELLLVGYPAEVDLFPSPTITRGILSRFREWERLGMTYFQTDAAIAGGQSGGALVNARGEVIGISTFSFSEAGFGLAASSVDIMPIVAKLTRGELTSGLGDRRIPVGRGSFEVDVELRNYWDTRSFVFDATAGTILEVAIEGQGDGWLHVSDAFGPILEVNDAYTGVEYGTAEVLTNGTHFLQVELASGESSSFELSSSVRLRPLNDPDDGRIIRIGETVVGSLDHLKDWDWDSIRLNESETVRISADSFNVDTLIYVDFPKSRDDQVVSDDDSGGGLFGTNSELVYRAPHTGEYFVAVTDATENAIGGYYLSVDAAREGTETVNVPPSPTIVDSPYGAMMVFEDPFDYFSLQVPEDWIEGDKDESLGEVFYAFDPNTNSDMLIIAEDVLALGLGALSLNEYADLIESSVLVPSGAENITRQTVLTSHGLSIVRFEMSLFMHRLIRIVYLFPDSVGVGVTYSFPPNEFDTGKQLADYTLDSFRVD